MGCTCGQIPQAVILVQLIHYIRILGLIVTPVVCSYYPVLCIEQKRIFSIREVVVCKGNNNIIGIVPECLYSCITPGLVGNSGYCAVAIISEGINGFDAGVYLDFGYL